MVTPTPEEQVETIIGRLEQQGVRAAPIVEAIELGRSHPESVADLATATIERFPRGGTFLDAALSYLPEARWDGLVGFALDTLERSGENEAAESVIAHASLQALPSLHPHLDRIFHLRPNGRTYYSDWPWRESGTGHLRFLRGVIEGGGSKPGEGLQAWWSMLQTRHPEMIAYALAHTDPMREHNEKFSAPENVYDLLHLVAYHRDERRLRRLCPDSLYHLEFPATYFEGQSRPPWLERIHPTWNLETASHSPGMAFGGHAGGNCSVCGGRLHRLIALDPVPEGLGITGLDQVELATCLSCLGWERAPLYYRHAAGGSHESIGYDGPKVEPQFPVGPLREAEVRLVETPHRWRWQDRALSNGRENLNRVGGEPCWVQSAEYPGCPICEVLMNFLMQLDSDLPTEDGGEWLWGSGGIGYGFWCDRCKVSAFHWQCT